MKLDGSVIEEETALLGNQGLGNQEIRD